MDFLIFCLIPIDYKLIDEKCFEVVLLNYDHKVFSDRTTNFTSKQINILSI